MSQLSPEQAADVIRYYHDGANQKYRQNGSSDRIALARAALDTTRSRQSILPDQKPLLTYLELANGLEYLLGAQEYSD